ncbi:hypothetical protein [Nocardia pneumoniae]|uniref:hypothetical protein n=1 Tax=Nocardia pneumoniae TaxID=228601 RepID=UPI000304821F|nr:hypothetical protein [Nocardia pneumoniae]
MTNPTPAEPDDPIGFADCLADPGGLTTDDAIRALSLHHNCPPQCRVLGRALETLDGQYVALSVVSAPGASPLPQICELDRRLADKLREYQRLATRDINR